MLGFLPTRAYRPGTPGATTFLSPLSGTFNYGWDSFRARQRRIQRVGSPVACTCPHSESARCVSGASPPPGRWTCPSDRRRDPGVRRSSRSDQLSRRTRTSTVRASCALCRRECLDSTGSRSTPEIKGGCCVPAGRSDRNSGPGRRACSQPSRRRWARRATTPLQCVDGYASSRGRNRLAAGGNGPAGLARRPDLEWDHVRVGRRDLP